MPRSHGTGVFTPADLARCGAGVVFEPGVLVFHPENIEIGDEVYIGHQTILKGYHRNKMVIGEGCWIGQQCFFHAAGGITLERRIGIGPGVRILTSKHRLPAERTKPILDGDIEAAPVTIGEGADVGVGAIILPGVRIGRGVQVGAGSVVTKDVEDYAIVAGVPARVIGTR